MSLSKQETNKLKHVSASEDKALSTHALHQLIPFPSIYLCETGFLLNYMHKKKAVPDLRIQPSNMKPNI
jgi:hypothetical protein